MTKKRNRSPVSEAAVELPPENFYAALLKDAMELLTPPAPTWLTPSVASLERKVIALIKSQAKKDSSRDWVVARDLVIGRVVSDTTVAKNLLSHMETSKLLVSEPYRPPRGGHTAIRYRRK